MYWCSLPADVRWGSFVTLMRDKRTPKDVCGEASIGVAVIDYNQPSMENFKQHDYKL